MAGFHGNKTKTNSEQQQRMSVNRGGGGERRRRKKKTHPKQVMLLPSPFLHNLSARTNKLGASLLITRGKGKRTKEKLILQDPNRQRQNAHAIQVQETVLIARQNKRGSLRPNPLAFPKKKRTKKAQNSIPRTSKPKNEEPRLRGEITCFQRLLLLRVLPNQASSEEPITTHQKGHLPMGGRAPILLLQ